jgi:tetratricopeptide (TPR) repeat protein
VTNLRAEEWLERWRAFRQRHPDHGQIPPADGLALHLREAGICEAAQRWHGALTHLEPLIAARPQEAALLLRRGNALAELGQWKKAAADFTRAAGLQELELNDGFRQALLCLAAGDLTGYRQVCASLVRRFGATTDAATAALVAWACVLGPQAVADYGPVVQLAEKAWPSGPRSGLALSRGPAALSLPTLFTRSYPFVVLYRAGQFQAALERSKRSAPQRVETLLFLAMVQHRAGNAKEARETLDRAVWQLDNMTKLEAGSDSGRSARPWTARLTDELLRREAEAVLNEVK